MADREPLLGCTHRTLNLCSCSHDRTLSCCLIRLIIFLLLVLAGLVLFAIFRHHHHVHEQPYYVLSIQWPPALCHSLKPNSCNKNCKPNISVNQWLIHGLWPQLPQDGTKQPSKWLQYCRNDTPFVLEKIESLRNKLYVDWTNLLRNQTDQAFWAYEWEKHGTCSPFNQYDYFNKTIALFRQFSVDRVLARQKILPSNSAHYKLEQFQQALKPLMGSEENMVLQCSKQKDQWLLKEIRLCFKLNDSSTDTGGFSPTKCSLAQPDCGPSFLYNL